MTNEFFLQNFNNEFKAGVIWFFGFGFWNLSTEIVIFKFPQNKKSNSSIKIMNLKIIKENKIMYVFSLKWTIKLVERISNL